MTKNDIKNLQNKVVKFCEERDWGQFHNPKDLALSLTLEATELLEIFQWKTRKETEKYLKKNKERVEEELSDVFYWILLLSHYLSIDIVKAFNRKMRKNIKKYPVKKVKSSHKKYTELEPS